MNYRGSYRRLLGNAKSALLAAIEIYNKPSFEYRDECFVILLMNAWELLLKAVLSKSKKSIYYPKKRNEPYRTLTWQDALSKVEQFKLYPSSIQILPLRRNLELLGTYRNNAVHFYNTKGFGSIIWALAQTSILNFKDILQGVFDIDLASHLNLELLPLGIRPPIDPIEYIAGRVGQTDYQNKAVRQFLLEMMKSVKEIENERLDTGRFFTVFKVHMQSTKKISSSDITVGVTGETEDAGGVIAIERKVDPNISHPLRQQDVLEQVEELHGRRFTSYVFQAIIWKYDIKQKPHLCWIAKEGVLTKYSREIVSFIRKLSPTEMNEALDEYREYMRSKRKKRLSDTKRN